MPSKLENLIRPNPDKPTGSSIPERIQNKTNADLLIQFYNYKKENDCSDRDIMNCLQAVMYLAEHLGDTNLVDVNTKEQLITFLTEREKHRNERYELMGKVPDPDKWVSTHNDYIDRITGFYRWLYNKDKDPELDIWETPKFVKRESTYDITETWTKEEVDIILPYEPELRNRAMVRVLWDLNGRNHEVIKLQLKHFTFKINHYEGEVPADTKTGKRPMMLTSSFPDVRDLINKHPFRNDPQAHLFISLISNKPIKSETLWHVTNNLKKRIQGMIDDGSIRNAEERDKLIFLLKTKAWNPYCFRHSSSDSDSEYLEDKSLNKKCGWSQKSKQSSVYLKNKFGKNLKRQILEQNGIPYDDDLKIKPAVRVCWDDKCRHINALENKLCDMCGRPLTQQALDELKAKENAEREQQFEVKLKTATHDLTNRIGRMEQMMAVVAQSGISFPVKNDDGSVRNAVMEEVKAEYYDATHTDLTREEASKAVRKGDVSKLTTIPTHSYEFADKDTYEARQKHKAEIAAKMNIPTDKLREVWVATRPKDQKNNK
jgi:integrase/recombinase XerD